MCISAALLLWLATCDSQQTFREVTALLGSHEYVTAGKMLDSLKRCTTLSPMERFEMGWLYGRSRNFSVALEVFNSVPANVPDLATHAYAVALSKFELHEYQRSVDVLKDLARQGDLTPESANLLAVSYSKLGLLKEAYPILVREIQAQPKDLSAYLNLVTVCAEGGDIAQAAEISTKASEVFPQSAEVFVVRGAANLLLGRVEESRSDFTKAADLSPKLAEPRFFIALTDYKLGDFAKALGLLQSAAASGIKDPDLYYLMAECLLKQDRTHISEAMDSLNRAIELNANSVSARTLRGKLFLEQGKISQALTDLQMANRLDASSRSAAYNLARAYQAQGKTAEAKLLFEQIKNDSGNTATEFGDKRLNEALTRPSGDRSQ